MSRTISGEEVKDVIKRGVNAVAEPVGDSMGAKGRITLINLSKVEPTKDGVTIARNITPKGELEPVVKVMHDAAGRALAESGDGTSNTMVLAQSMTLKGLESKESNPIDIKRGIDIAVDKVVEYIKENSVSVTDDYEKLERVAVISANNDEATGSLIAKAAKGVGIHGIIDVDYSRTTETYVEFSEGLVFESGYIQPNFINVERANVSDLRNPLILITEDEITDFKDLGDIWRKAAEAGRNLLVVASDVKGQALATVLANLNNEKLHSSMINIVKAPFLGSLRTDFLTDLAIVTGGKVISKRLGTHLSEITTEDFGQADKVISTKGATSIRGAKGDKQAIEDRAESIKQLMAEEKEASALARYKERVAKLTGGTATIFVGANSESERAEKLARIDDSLRAVGSAIKEGVSTGGGVTLLRAESALEGLIGENPDIQVGIDVVRKSLSAGITRMLKNAGLKSEYLVEKIRSSENPREGYNLHTNKISDLFEDGVLDASSVIITSLRAASSVAGILLMTSHIILDDEK